MEHQPIHDRLAGSRVVGEIRAELLEKIWFGMAFIALLGVPASVSRSLDTGWLDIYSIHIALGALTLLAFGLRRRLGYRLNVGVIILVFWGVGLVGAFRMGLMGSGLWWLTMSALPISVLVSLRWGVIAVMLVLAVLLVVASGFISGKLVLPVDANDYARAPSAWATLLIGTTLMFVIVFMAFAAYQRAMVRLVDTLDMQQVQIEHLASHDALTGLPRMSVADSRLACLDTLGKRPAKDMAVIYLDLDGFKDINDRYGHEAGDLVLTRLAERMKARMPKGQVLARKGGDEFVAVLESISDASEAVRVAEALVNAVSQTVSSYADAELTVGASAGVALSTDRNLDSRALLRAADQAMYRAKRAGRNQVRLSLGGSDRLGGDAASG